VREVVAVETVTVEATDCRMLAGTTAVSLATVTDDRGCDGCAEDSEVGWSGISGACSGANDGG
jgi:hypothetical protein